MKKIVLAFSLAVATLVLVSPALAETNDSQPDRKPSAADQAFLASLARQVPINPASAAARKPDEPPIGENALCDATAFCWDGSTRHCYGNNSTVSCTAVDSSCPSQRGYVTCDGVTTWCPPCPDTCPPDWCEGDSECAMNCAPCDYTYTCNATYCTDFCRCKWSTCPI